MNFDEMMQQSIGIDCEGISIDFINGKIIKFKYNII
jgi:hypothetical protein